MSLVVDTLITPKWILTLENELQEGPLLTGYSLAISGDIISNIAPTEQLIEEHRSARHIQLPQQLLMPGLINTHGHAAMSLFRGMADDLPLMDWLNDHIWPAEGQWVSKSFVADGTKLAIAEMLRSGTTCYSDMYFFPEIAAEVSADYQMRARLYGPILDFPTPYGAGADEYIHKIVTAHDKFKHHSLVSIGFGPHAPYTVSDEPLTKIRTLANQLDIPIQIHLHETAFEVSDAIEKSGMRPTERLEKLGFWGPDVQAVHVTQLNDLDTGILSENNVSVVHCPESNLKLASGFCPVHKLQQAGVNVALGTDGAASNNDLDMLGEMHTAALLAKAVAQDASAVPAIEAIKMATINGAKALGLDNLTGSLKVGKQADIISIDLSGLESQPVYDPVSHIVYCSTRNQVSHVWVAGRLQLESGHLTHINEQEICEIAQSWSAKISSNH